MIGSSNQSLQTYYGGSKGLSADKGEADVFMFVRAVKNKVFLKLTPLCSLIDKRHFLNTLKDYFLFRLEDEGIFNCWRYFTITRLEQYKSSSSNLETMASSVKGFCLSSL